MIHLPKPGQYPAYFQNYINLLPTDTFVYELLQRQSEELLQLLKTIDEEKGEFAYAPGKWTVKELVQHLIDSERVFSYRAMCIARGEKASLPGFDENTYAANSFAARRTLSLMVEELKALRQATISFFTSLPDEVLDNEGIANEQPVTVRAILFVIPGHERHHINILKERYLQTA